jgi:hypothetical protein
MLMYTVGAQTAPASMQHDDQVGVEENKMEFDKLEEDSLALAQRRDFDRPLLQAATPLSQPLSDHSDDTPAAETSMEHGTVGDLLRPPTPPRQVASDGGSSDESSSDGGTPSVALTHSDHDEPPPLPAYVPPMVLVTNPAVKGTYSPSTLESVEALMLRIRSEADAEAQKEMDMLKEKTMQREAAAERALVEAEALEEKQRQLELRVASASNTFKVSGAGKEPVEVSRLPSDQWHDAQEQLASDDLSDAGEKPPLPRDVEVALLPWAVTQERLGDEQAENTPDAKQSDDISPKTHGQEEQAELSFHPALLGLGLERAI